MRDAGDGQHQIRNSNTRLPESCTAGRSNDQDVRESVASQEPVRQGAMGGRNGD
jgi:hypothetical protein